MKDVSAGKKRESLKRIEKDIADKSANPTEANLADTYGKRFLKRNNCALAAMVLAALVVAVYWPVAGYDFIGLDDNLYILDNPNVKKGFTLAGASWAMTALDATNWHPLTWLSYMLDYELFGLNPAGYHLVNLLLHIFNSLLLFIIFRRMTGDVWKSWVVAALFAVHPLNIESVVWIAERKNLLSTFFWLLSMAAYVHYTIKPGWKRYSVLLFSFVMGLTAKPMLITLPFVLLFVDYWPLRRFSIRAYDPSINDVRKSLKPLLVEKAPLFVLSILSAVITYYAADSGGAVKSISTFPIIGRFENAITSYMMYLYKMLWPTELSIFYPYQAGYSLWMAILSILLFGMAAVAIFIIGRKYPYLRTGFFWYWITLFPVIGIVKVGFQSMANRYAYIPLIGIFMMIAWGVPDLLKRFSWRRYLPAGAIALIIVFSFVSKASLPNWKNSEAVFQYALKVTKNNHIAEMGMGNVWLLRGNMPEARLHYIAALKIKPDYAEAHNNLALVLMHQGKMEEAAVQSREAIKDRPDYAEAYNNLAVALAFQNKKGPATEAFRRAMELDPESAAQVKKNMANMLGGR